MRSAVICTQIQSKSLVHQVTTANTAPGTVMCSVPIDVCLLPLPRQSSSCEPLSDNLTTACRYSTPASGDDGGHDARHCHVCRWAWDRGRQAVWRGGGRAHLAACHGAMPCFTGADTAAVHHSHEVCCAGLLWLLFISTVVSVCCIHIHHGICVLYAVCQLPL